MQNFKTVPLNNIRIFLDLEVRSDVVVYSSKLKTITKYGLLVKYP
jgi:hypothetical protein